MSLVAALPATLTKAWRRQSCWRRGPKGSPPQPPPPPPPPPISTPFACCFSHTTFRDGGGSGRAAAAADAAATVTISCLFLMILPSSAAATSAGQQYRLQLQVLGEVVSGPAWGRPLALHLDAALPADVRQAVLGVEAVRRTPHLTLSLGLTHSHGRQEAAAAALPRGPFFSSSSLLHVVVWLRPRRELLQALWLHWKPRNLLFLSLGASGGADVLRDEALSGVARLALIGHLEAQADTRPDALGVYTVLPFSPSGVQLLGPWRQESFSRWEALLPDRFPSFHGYTFHVATRMQDEPFFYRSDRNPRGRDGVCELMLQALSTKLNFTYTATADSPDSKWGSLSNGSWEGLLGMLERGEKNFTANILYNNYDRAVAFDVSVSFHIDGYGVFLPRPAPLPLWQSLWRPLQASTWLAVLVSLVAGVLVTKLQEDVVARREHRRAKGRGVADVWLQLQGTLVGQSAPDLPHSTRQRVFMGVWLLCCLVVTAAYTCNLVGIFTRPAHQRPLRTLHELIHSHFRLALPDSGNVMLTTLRKSQDPLYVSLREKTDLYPSVEECLDAVVKGTTHAFLENIPYATLMIGRALLGGGWYMVPQRLKPSPGSWFFPKWTAWKHKIDVGMRQLVEAGMVQHWYQVKNDELTDGGSDGSARQGSGKDGPAPSLSLRHLQGVFYILGLAWVASGALLLLELLAHTPALLTRTPTGTPVPGPLREG